jgi:hypothetical protein
MSMRRAAGYNATLTPYLRGAVPHPTATCSNPDFSDVVTASSSGNQPYWDVEICGMVEILAEIGMAIGAVGGQKSKQSPTPSGLTAWKAVSLLRQEVASSARSSRAIDVASADGARPSVDAMLSAETPSGPRRTRSL